MGIPRLFHFLLKNNPDCLHRIKDGQTFQDIGINVDCLSLDLNSLIHPVCQKIFNYGGNGNKKDKSFLHQKSKPTTIPNDKQIFSAICRKIEDIKMIVNPIKKLTIMIDGVAGLSKQAQQRQRRFKSALERKKDCNFNSDKITTGSEFMNDLSKYIHINIQRQLENSWKNLEVIFSNEKVVSEGEHKILQYIKKNPTESFCVDSPDADLVMLLLSLGNKELYIIRENIYRDIDCKYFVVDIPIFKQYIIKQFRWGSTEHKYTDEQLVHDFILICFMLGNDFLNHIPSLEISNDGLDVLMNIYPHVASRFGHLTYRKNGELCLNTKALQQLFFSLAQEETPRLKKKSEDRSIDFPDTILQSCINNEGIDTKLNFKKYRKEYYEKKLHNCDPYDVCHEYFKGMLFVLRYYIDEIPDYQWFYPFHNAPFFGDMYESIEDFDGEMKFEKNPPLSSFEQLLAVMPPGSIDILPECLRELILDEESPIADFYPSKFVIDLDGKKALWEGIAILPFIDVKRLQIAYNDKKDGLTEMEVKRNNPGKNIRYNNYDGNVRVMFF